MERGTSLLVLASVKWIEVRPSAFSDQVNRSPEDEKLPGCASHCVSVIQVLRSVARSKRATLPWPPFSFDPIRSVLPSGDRLDAPMSTLPVCGVSSRVSPVATFTLQAL